MLTGILRAGAVATVATVLVLGWSIAAFADGGTGSVNCDTNPVPGCDLDAGTAGNEGDTGDSGTGGSTGDGKCRNPQGVVIPCERDGAWAGADGCYYKPLDLSSETIAGLGGQPAGAGGWYAKTCYSPVDGSEQAFGGPVWMAGAPPVLSPEVLARQARAKLRLPNVEIQLNPAGDQLVRLPTWLALASSSWTEQSATAAVPGVSVTATARPVKATWVMGDGSTVVCDGPGTPWKPGTDPAAASPDCGHRYLRSSASAPGAAYSVTVTVGWEVTWAGAGQSGTIPGLETTGAAQVRVAELQALVTR